MTVPVAPSPNNYFIGKGIVTIKREGETVFKDLGNCPEVEYTPSAENLDHFSSREGVQTKDKTVILQKGGELRILMEELTADNLALLVCGSIDNTNPASPKVFMFDLNATSAEVRFYATNEVGPKWDAVWNGVDFLPSGSFQPITDEWGNLEITGQCKTVNGSFGYFQLRDAESLAPINIAAPVISGSEGATVGDTLSTTNGTWMNSPTSYTYAWQRNAAPIVSATNQTYDITAPDVNAEITCIVTATNASGSDSAESAAFSPSAYT